jgi:hypothetical protein
MLSSDDQEFVRNAIDHARNTFTSEDSTEMRSTLEQLEKAARLITDAMFRPTGLASGPAEKPTEEDAEPVSEVS